MYNFGIIILFKRSTILIAMMKSKCIALWHVYYSMPPPKKKIMEIEG